MELHHSKHHQTYVTNVNVAMEKNAAAEAAGDMAALIALQGAIKFNGGGKLYAPFFSFAPSKVHNCFGKLCTNSPKCVCPGYQTSGHVNHSIFWTNLCPKKV